MTKKTFDSRNMPLQRRMMAVKTYHKFRGNCDWAAIYWEVGKEKTGDRFLQTAKKNLRDFEDYTRGHDYMMTYALRVEERWRSMFRREAWISAQIEALGVLQGAK